MQSENKAANSCAVDVKVCFEQLVEFTLQSFVDGVQEFQRLGLSRDFCSTLLKDDPDDPFSDNTDSLEGVPPYPLYKRLASALMKCISSEAFCITDNNLIMVHENDSIRQKQNEWQKLILDKGSEILDILKSISFELHVQEPFFSQLKDGLKTIEGRCAVGKYSRIELGNLILINKSVVFEVQGVRWYPTFSDMLEAESLGKVLPGVENIEEGVGVYRRFYTEDKEKANGVLAINVSKLGHQPYDSLVNLFAGLSHEGVQGLLGLMHTIGTIPDALPPPRSVLLTSFNLPYKRDVRK